MGTPPGVKEGDSPSFLYLVSALRGLNDPERPNQPSWGGRFVRADPARNHWLDAPSPKETVSRWIQAFDNDFAARMDWCVREFDEANHAPVITLAGDRERDVRPGETVLLQASANDPDGDELTFRWRQETKVDLSSRAVTIADSDSDHAAFVVPDEPGKQVYVILEVTDDGAPPLVGYQRLIFRIY